MYIYTCSFSPQNTKFKFSCPNKINVKDHLCFPIMNKDYCFMNKDYCFNLVQTNPKSKDIPLLNS